MRETLAILIARLAHRGQKRWEGGPYIEHPLRVGAGLEGNARIAGILHDVLEDSRTPRLVIRLAVGAKILRTVEVLTHRKGEKYADYIERVATSGDVDAVAVKIADILDNLPTTIGNGMRLRYEKALKRLGGA